MSVEFTDIASYVLKVSPVFLGEALNGDIGLSLKDRKICFLLLFYDRTVLFGIDSIYIKSLASYLNKRFNKASRVINGNLMGVASLGLGVLLRTPTVKKASGPSPS